MRPATRPFTVALLVGLSLPVAAVAQPSTSQVKRTMKSGDRDAVAALLGELEGQLDRHLVKAVLDAAPEVKRLGVYDDLVGCLRSARGDALEELVKKARRERASDVRFLCIDALGGNPDAGAEAALLEALEEDKDETIAVLAARHLGRRGTASAVDGLIELLERLEGEADKTRLVREINGALGSLTGQDLQVAQDWKNYWSAHKAEFTSSGPVADDGASHTRDENVLDRLKRERPADARTMERLREDDIVVIRGRSDKVELVLEALDLPHVRHDRSAFDGVQLDPSRQVLVLNCAGNEDLSDQGIQKIRAFVAQGGYLFTSDWELRNTLAKAFPEAVAFLGETPRDPKEGMEVSIRPHPQTSNHPLMRDVFPLSTWTERSFKWSLDSRSHLVRENPALIPLVICPEIESMGSMVVAFTFGFTDRGGGRPMTGIGGRQRVPGGQVLHVTSHFKNQKDASGDGFALQQLLLNFIVEKKEAAKAAARGD